MDFLGVRVVVKLHNVPVPAQEPQKRARAAGAFDARRRQSLGKLASAAGIAERAQHVRHGLHETLLRCEDVGRRAPRAHRQRRAKPLPRSADTSGRERHHRRHRRTFHSDQVRELLQQLHESAAAIERARDAQRKQNLFNFKGVNAGGTAEPAQRIHHGLQVALLIGEDLHVDGSGAAYDGGGTFSMRIGGNSCPQKDRTRRAMHTRRHPQRSPRGGARRRDRGATCQRCWLRPPRRSLR